MSAFRSHRLKCLDIQIKEWPITDRLISLPTRSALQRHTRSHTHTCWQQPPRRRPLFVHKNIDVAKWYAGSHRPQVFVFVCLSLCRLSRVNNATVMPGWKNPSKLKQLWNLIYYVCMISTYCFFLFSFFSRFCSVKSEGKNLGVTWKHTCPEWSQSSYFSSVKQ